MGSSMATASAIRPAVHHAPMGGFGYLGQQSATCSACGRRIPNEDEPGIVWAVSVDGRSFDPFSETCVARRGLRVHERVHPHPDPYRRRGLTCSRCGIDVPAPQDGGWVLLMDDKDCRPEGICNGCRGKERRETRLAMGPREENEEEAVVPGDQRRESPGARMPPHRPQW